MLDGGGERLLGGLGEEIIDVVHGGNDICNRGSAILREEEGGRFVDLSYILNIWTTE